MNMFRGIDWQAMNLNKRETNVLFSLIRCSNLEKSLCEIKKKSHDNMC